MHAVIWQHVMLDQNNKKRQPRRMQTLQNVWKGFRILPSAWLLFLQFVILLLSLFAHHNMPYKVITWMVGIGVAADC